MRDLCLDLCGGPQELALAFAAREVVAADYAKREMLRGQAPLPPLRRGLERAKAVRINAARDDVDFGMVTQERRAGAALRLRRVRFINPLTQHFVDEV